jgi:hypothetical protein
MGADPADTRRAAATIKRSVARASDQVAEGFSRFVGDASERRLERLMQTPLRRVVLGAIFWQMPRHVDRERAGAMSWSIRWKITGRPNGGADVYHLQLAERRATVIRGEEGPDSRLTITVDGAEFLRLATGNSDPMQAYFNGRVALAGDIMLAAKLGSVFRIPAARRAPA